MPPSKSDRAYYEQLFWSNFRWYAWAALIFILLVIIALIVLGYSLRPDPALIALGIFLLFLWVTFSALSSVGTTALGWSDFFVDALTVLWYVALIALVAVLTSSFPNVKDYLSADIVGLSYKRLVTKDGDDEDEEEDEDMNNWKQ